MMSKFVPLHIHSDFSLLDGASQLPQLIGRAVELDMPAIALTDHGVMYGAIQLIKQCRSKGIKPIIGNEMYVVNGELSKQEYRRKKYHQIVLAKNTLGYKNLVKLTTISHLKGFQGRGIFARPCINKELLAEYHEGLIVTSACLGGEVPQAILQGKLDVAYRTAEWYKEIFGDDYYLEIQDHGSPEDRIVNLQLVKIAQELNIKIVATNDSHFISCYDVESHDALLCINTQKLITEEKRLRYSGTEYLKSAEEMSQLFRDHLPDEIIQAAIANTVEVADKVQGYDLFNEPRIPNYPIPQNHNAATYLEELAWEGLQERLGLKERAEIPQRYPEYEERLKYELKMIEQMGFSTYFLVVWDYIKFARDNNIPVGPGRGSAAGSLVAYVLKITNIDPVYHGLLFERFLNPERKSMPDIDTDFCIERRDEVIKYVTQTYGEDCVAQIITFNRMTSKAVLKDVGRVLNIPYKKADEMAKLIPVSRGKPTKLKVMISEETPAPEFKKAYNEDPEVRHWVDLAIRIEGTNKTFGVHAAGVVISKEPLDQVVPLQHNNDGAVITQYYMEDLESLGLLKMDFLGLKNLTMIQKTVELIHKTQNPNLTAEQPLLEIRKSQEIYARQNKWPTDVAKTYKILENGDLEGIFQLESSGMLDVVRKLKPSCIEDISSILALYRPGPLDAGLIPKFIDRKHGREAIHYEHPLLESILQETYAVLVYQEQIMKMAQDLAGYSLGQADLLRRAMGKKKAEEMQKQRSAFIDGSTRNGVDSKLAESLFDQMVLFAEYCFNKSHSTAYAYVTYQTAYLKANYPVEYMAALLTANSGDQDKVQKYIANCQKLGIEVEPPDINRSYVDFTPLPKITTGADKDKIVFGLSAIKNIGDGAIENILTARQSDGPFTSLADLCTRINLSAVNKRAFEALIYCGAFDSLEPNRNQLLHDLEGVIKWAQDRNKDRDSGQGNLLDLLGGGGNSNEPIKTNFDSAPKHPPVKDFSPQEKLKLERELLGFYVSDHPLKVVLQSAPIEDAITLDQLETKSGKKVTVIVMLAAIKPHVTKKGERMAFLQLEDMTGQSDSVVFPKTYEEIHQFLIPNAVLVITGKVDKREDQYQILIDKAEPVEKVLQNAPLPAPTTDILSMSEALMVLLKFSAQDIVAGDKLEILQSILQEYSGNQDQAKVPVGAIVAGETEEQLVRFGPQFWVEDGENAVERLRTSGFDVTLTSMS